MIFVQVAVVIFLAGRVDLPSGGALAIWILVGIAAVEFLMMLRFVQISRSGDDDADSGEGGGGSDGPTGPPEPPPSPDTVSWPEFERQFAEHVAAHGVREGAQGR